MSGRVAVQLFLIIVCTLAILTDCARPVRDDELSTVILRLLETSQTSYLLPPRLSPAHRVENMFNMQRRQPFPNEEYNVKSDESPKTRSQAEFNQIAGQKHRKNTYNSVLHKNSAGPNPIGNEYRPGNKVHNVKKYRCPPPEG